METPRSSVQVPPTPSNNTTASGNPIQFSKESSTLLALFSIFLLVEGCFRFQYSISYKQISGKWGGSDSDESPNFPAIALLLGGLFEIWFASLGLWIGLGHMLFNISHSYLTVVLLFLQLLLGTFTYLVWTIAYPGFDDDRLSGFDNLQVPFFTNSQAHAARVFGQILTGMSWDAIMQGAQFMFALALYRFQNNTHQSKYDPQSYKLRMVVVSLIIFGGGVSTLIAGGLFRQHDGQGNYGGWWYYFPNIIAYSEVTIITGLVVMFLGIFGLLCCINSNLTSAFLGYAFLAWIWLLTAHNQSQIAKAQLPGFPYNYLWEKTGMTSLMICLTTSLVLTPMFLASRLSGNYSAVSSGF